MKRLVSSLILITLISPLANADCTTDCKNALNAADMLIQDLKDEISVRKNLEESQQTQIVSLTLQNEEKETALASPFRNPFIVGGIGISIGAITVLLLKK